MRHLYDTEYDFNYVLGRIMKRRRLAEGITRRQLLHMMEGSWSTSLLYNYETGAIPVSLHFITKWCEVMGIGITKLLEVVKHEMDRMPSEPAAWAGAGADSE